MQTACPDRQHTSTAYLLTDGGVPAVVVQGASQHHSVQVWYDVELAISIVVVLDPGRLHPHYLTPAFHDESCTHMHWYTT